jgi:osomolarity two-component system sensor histidine kinase NIK1
VPTFKGEKTPAQEGIERAILALGERVRIGERGSPINNAVAEPPVHLLKPEWTPPADAPSTASSSRACPICATVSDSTPKPTNNHIVKTAPPASGWAESGMSAEEELELLQAQVQDIARVCKVIPTLTFDPDSTD